MPQVLVLTPTHPHHLNYTLPYYTPRPTMTSPNSSSTKGPPPPPSAAVSRGSGSKRSSITTLTIPGPSSSSSGDDDSSERRLRTGSTVGEAAGLLHHHHHHHLVEENCEDKLYSSGEDKFPSKASASDFRSSGSAMSASERSQDRDDFNHPSHSCDVICDSKEDRDNSKDCSSQREFSGNQSEFSEEGSTTVSESDHQQQQEPSSSVTHAYHAREETADKHPTLPESEIVPALKRKDSPRDSRDRTSSSGSSINRSVSMSEPVVELSTDTKRQPSVSSTFSDHHVDSKSADDNDSSAPSQPPAAAIYKRRISFPADSVLTAVIQDGDTAELLRILTGRHGPGLVQVRGEGGVLRGVDVRQSNHVGLTALHHAVLANNVDAAKLLLCYGADVNAQDVHGFSPLHTAAACGFLPLTSLLLLFGADVFAQTLEHELPIDVAKELRIVRVLSAEMTRLVHQELWVTSAIYARADEAWLLVRKLLAWVFLYVLHLCVAVRTVWRTRHRKTD